MRCGAEPIAALTDESKRAKAVVSQYEITLKELLVDSPWNFATAKVELEELSEVPLFGFSKMYDLPSDCVKVLELENKVPYRVEGQHIVCDQEGTIKVKYVSNAISAEKYSGAFVKALSLKLAEDISYLLVQSASLQQAIAQEAERYLRKARSMNSQEGTPESRYPDEYTIGIRL